VKETEFALAPADATASAGKLTIKVTDGGQIGHALSIEKAGPGGKDVESGPIAPGSSKSVTVTLKPGTYEWYCPIGNHKAQGMVGKLTVK
jgi:uncharacterized cupredoxin-like copper-binding protein